MSILATHKANTQSMKVTLLLKQSNCFQLNISSLNIETEYEYLRKFPDYLKVRSKIS